MSKKDMKEWFLDVPWGKLAMISWGSPSSPPLLLVHGYIDTAATFLPLVDAMPPSYYYVTFDQPGHGRSDTMPGPPISPLQLVEAIRQIVRKLRWGSFDCIAHSMGFLICAFYNAVSPGRIKRLVCLAGAISISMHGLVEHPKAWFEICIAGYYDRYFVPPPPLTYTYDKALTALADARDIGEKEAAVLATRCLDPVDDETVKFSWDVKAKKIFVSPIAEDVLYKIMSSLVPTLCLVPTEDKTIIVFKDYYVNMLTKLIGPKFVMVDVPGGHSLHLTNPEFVVPHVIGFLKRGKVSGRANL